MNSPIRTLSASQSSGQSRSVELEQFIAPQVSLEGDLTPASEQIERQIDQIFKRAADGTLRSIIPVPNILLWPNNERVLSAQGARFCTYSLSFSDAELNLPEISDAEILQMDLSSELASGVRIETPVCSANMQSVINRPLAKAEKASGLMPIYHRYFGHADQLQFVQELEGHCFVSCGTKDPQQSLKDAVELLDAGAQGINIDVTHGDSYRAYWLCQKIKEVRPDSKVILGNICSVEAVIRAKRAGADAVKVGMGPGSPCTTRVVTGVGEPQITAIVLCATVAEELGIRVIADGGVLDPFLALAMGAHSYMYGQEFSKTVESAVGALLDQHQTPGSDFEIMAAGSRLEPSETRQVMTAEEIESLSTTFSQSEMPWGLKMLRRYFGEASLDAIKRRSSADEMARRHREGLTPEGVGKMVLVDQTLEQLLARDRRRIAAGLKAMGCATIAELHQAMRTSEGFNRFCSLAKNPSTFAITAETELPVINVTEIDRPWQFDYAGPGKYTRPEFDSTLPALEREIADHGPQAAIPITGPLSNAQAALEEHDPKFRIPSLEISDLCLAPRYARAELNSRLQTDVTTYLTKQLSLSQPYLAANVGWVTTPQFVPTLLENKIPPFLPSTLRPAVVFNLLAQHPNSLFVTIPCDAIGAGEFAQRCIEQGALGILLEQGKASSSQLLAMIENLRSSGHSCQIVAEGPRTFDTALQSIKAGVDALKVNFEIGDGGATALASVATAARRYEIPVIGYADSFGTKDAHTVLTLGASSLMTARLFVEADEFKTPLNENRTRKIRGYYGRRFLGDTAWEDDELKQISGPNGRTLSVRHPREVQASEPLRQLILTRIGSLRSALTFQGVRSIDELHTMAIRDPNVRLVIPHTYTAEMNPRTLRASHAPIVPVTVEHTPAT